MALTETNIANMALSELGVALLTNLDSDTSDVAVQCQLHFDQTRDALLRSHAWPFAMKQADLALDSSDPLHDWENQYVLPSDCLRVVSVWVNGEKLDGQDYEVSESYLWTDDTELYVRYVTQVTDVTAFDALFVDCLALSLAAKLAGPLLQDSQRAQLVEAKLKDRLAGARAIALDEQPDTPEPTWRDCRNYITP